MELKYRAGGREVSREEFLGNLDATMTEKAAAQIRQLVGEVQCPEHKKPPTLLMERQGSAMKVSVDACCETFKSEVAEMVKKA